MTESLNSSTEQVLMQLSQDSSRSALLNKLLKEKEKRDLQSDLISFTRYNFEARGETFIVSLHHKLIAEALAKVVKGEIKNLLINIPPRYGKTELAVINWIAQCIAVNPKAKFIHLSYSDELALENSSKIKELILSDEYQDYWPLSLKDDSKSKAKWNTKQGGGVYATAAGGAITGFGAGSTESEEFSGAIVIDDPHKVDDIDQDGKRNKVNKRLNTTIKSRRNNRNTPIIIIMQRLHEEDMSGFVLNGGMEEEFYHLKLPAIMDGEPLWPFKHTMEDLEKERRADPRTFSGQMMQEPSPEDGTYFKRNWFKRFEIGGQPELCMYGAGDYAVTEPEPGNEPDFSELGVGGFDKDENFWLVDWWSGQTTSDVWINEQMELVKKHQPYVWVAEGGIIRRAIEPFLKSKMKSKDGEYFRTEWLTSNKNKSANARSFQALASQGKVYIPNTPWGEELISQLLKFPTGKYDDKVDVCGLFGRILHQTFSPSEIEPDEQEAQEDDYEYEDDEDDDDWMTQ